MAVGASLLMGLAACDRPTATEVPASPQYASLGPTLIECPTTVEASTEGVLGSTGGTIALKGHALSLPLQAVKGQHKFTLRERASNYMELDLRGNGQEAYGFAKPVLVTIDYSRCSRTNIDKAPLAVWKIDLRTKALLKFMGGVDDKVARKITFVTDSLSGYSIANAPSEPDAPTPPDSTGTP